LWWALWMASLLFQTFCGYEPWLCLLLFLWLTPRGLGGQDATMALVDLRRGSR
jgi:hypothetical protein